MRLATFDDDRVGILHNGSDELTDVTHVVDGLPGRASRMRRLIGAWDTLDKTTLLKGETRRLADLRLDAPVPDPTKIIAAPVNYADHQSEMHQAAHVSALGFFLKAPSSVLRPGGVVELPYHDRRFDQEGEFACVVGRRARKVPSSEALSYVFAYTGLLDITMRGGEDRSVRKSFETFTPMGPWLVTADELGAPDNVELECSVNGEARQKASTGSLIWDVARLVSYASWVTTLEPGDVITTGTPAGVGPLQHGDRIKLVLSRIGTLEVTVSANGAVASHTAGKNTGVVP